MLAVAIAASTVALTPGLASAVPRKFLGRKTNRSASFYFDDPNDPRKNMYISNSGSPEYPLCDWLL